MKVKLEVIYTPGDAHFEKDREILAIYGFQEIDPATGNPLYATDAELADAMVHFAEGFIKGMIKDSVAQTILETLDPIKQIKTQEQVMHETKKAIRAALDQTLDASIETTP